MKTQSKRDSLQSCTRVIDRIIIEVVNTERITSLEVGVTEAWGRNRLGNMLIT